MDPLPSPHVCPTLGGIDMTEHKTTTRGEHLQWCKDRALEYVERGDLPQAWSSMASDLGKHPETKNHPAIELGTMLIANGHNNTKEEMRKFILGFN